MGAAKHWIPVGLAALLVAALASPAWAGGGHGRGHGHGHGHGGGHYRSQVWFGYGPAYGWGLPGLYWGPRYYAPYYPAAYPYPVYAPPRVIVQEPPVYIEREPVASGSWYYCESAGAYYPDVETCDEPWVRVPARD